MIDHIGVGVTNLIVSKEFYRRALEPVGYRVLAEIPAEVTGGGDAVGYGVPPKPDFWIGNQSAGSPRIHVAFRVVSRALVEAFYRAALAAGGRDNGAPGLRPHYHEHYYGAFVLDPDGNNIEAVCHEPVI
jgi:catechol 2,3-dioxygenase-like lactoylglutathione lyase family enzyme